MIPRRVFQSVFRLALAVVFVVGMGTISAAAQAAPPRSRGPVYNPATEITRQGTVEAVRQVSGPGGWAGTHLTLETGHKTIDVHLGPSWYLARRKIHFAKGDPVEVIGSRVGFQGKPVLLAREIAMGKRTITLRDARGFPLWARGRRRRTSPARSR